MTIDPRIVYSRRYNLGFPGIQRLHPFDIRKYGRAYREIRHSLGRGALRRITLAPSAPISRDELLAVHTPAYLKSLRDPVYVANAVEVWQLRRVPMWLLDRWLMRPMRWAASGTVLAAREALKRGLAFNLGGGYHHTGPARGEGFCLYADVATAVAVLRGEGLLSETDRFVHVDLDAHQGNGVCHCFFEDPRAMLYDQYNAAIYPAFDVKAKRRIDCDVPLPRGCRGADYLAALESHLSVFLDSITRNAPLRLAFYNAGTDVYEQDQLGGLSLSAADVLRRDQFVLRELRARGIPTVVLTSGGYSSDSYKLIVATVIAAVNVPA
jgi:histone deacetylase 11